MPDRLADETGLELQQASYRSSGSTSSVWPCPTYPTVKPVLSMLAMQKLISTFGPKLAEFINPITGRIHASYNHCRNQGGQVLSLEAKPATTAKREGSGLPEGHRRRTRQRSGGRGLVPDRTSCRRLDQW